MKIIKTTKGIEILVSDCDYNDLSSYSWHILKNKKTTIPYAKRTSYMNRKSVSILMHRQIMNCQENKEVDHINGNGLDNQRENLRVCSLLENRRNRGPQKDQKNKYIGVIQYKDIFYARVWFDNKSIMLGKFKTEFEAALARDDWVIRHRGVFAKLNFNTVNIPVAEETK